MHICPAMFTLPNHIDTCLGIFDRRFLPVIDKQEVVDFLAIENNILIYSLFRNYYFQSDIPI